MAIKFWLESVELDTYARKDGVIVVIHGEEEKLKIDGQDIYIGDLSLK